ncbi:hypothetical protein LTR97_001028 [Elasticomyces elasticus]|uniref:Uncharacterized protein n=1 Tax=Elasticomyces elasticus TaxID=574655 RepID=A0AAN7WQ33_9PEZI|nr:hypothetical protein LTR97_001028 [Elasticomyces elasticus]
MSPSIRLSSKASGLRFPSLAEALNYQDFLVKFLGIHQDSGTPAVVKRRLLTRSAKPAGNSQMGGSFGKA